MRIAYFDCFNGAAGDMILGALLDAGDFADELRAVLRGLPIDGYELSIDRVTKQGFAATRFAVALDTDRKQPHRHLADVRKIIEAGSLPDAVVRRSLAVFGRLAEAEASVHGTSMDKIHFHEVGAVDAIIDIVGACWAIDRLAIDRVVCSPIPVGSGEVRCAHGVLPVPAPATALLLRGVPLASTDETGELTTPTGAAVLTEWADSFGPVPAMRIDSIGMGAGHRDGRERPNCLRVMLGETVEEPLSDRIAILEANVDDATPEILGHALERLLDAGALDAYCLPIHMKKSRPATLLTVLVEPDRVAAIERILFEETTTFGIRRHDASRTKLARRCETVSTRYGKIRLKLGLLGDRLVTVAPEYDDCKKAAAQHSVALRVVMTEAADAWRAQQSANE